MRETKEISDLGFIAALVTLGYQPLESRDQGTRVLLTFEWDDNMRDIESKYFSNELVGTKPGEDFRTYQGVLRDIKKQYLYRGER